MRGIGSSQVQFSADRETCYSSYPRIAEILAAARQAGIVKLGFVNLPDR
jgi:biopolymer transport protein ExbD